MSEAVTAMRYRQKLAARAAADLQDGEARRDKPASNATINT